MKKAFSNILIIGIVAAVVLISAGMGGYFVFIKQEASVPPTVSTTPISSSASLSIGESATVRGIVLENHTEGVVRDLPAYLRLKISGDGEIKVIYNSGEAECVNPTDGFSIKQGEEIEVFGKVVSEDAISTCESKDYYIKLTTADTSTWKTYRDENFGFQLKFPPDQVADIGSRSISEENTPFDIYTAPVGHFTFLVVARGSKTKHYDKILDKPIATNNGLYYFYVTPGNPLTDKIIKTLEFVGKDIDTSSWQTYRNEKYGFEVRYPPGWHNEECVDNYFINFGDITIPKLCDVRMDSVTIYGPINIEVFTVRPPDTTDTYARAATLQDFKELPLKSSIVIDDHPATMLSGKIKYRYGSNTNINQGIEVVFGDGNKVFKLTYRQIDKDISSLFNQIISTFRFIPSAGSGQVEPQ